MNFPARPEPEREARRQGEAPGATSKHGRAGRRDAASVPRSQAKSARKFIIGSKISARRGRSELFVSDACGVIASMKITARALPRTHHYRTLFRDTAWIHRFVLDTDGEIADLAIEPEQ